MSKTHVSAAKKPRGRVSAYWHKVIIGRVLQVVGHSDYTPFIVLGRSRTGSTLLETLLNSHSHISAQGEIFAWLKKRHYSAILQEVFSKQPRRIKAAGFRIFYYHPFDDESQEVWQALRAMSDLHVIHLKRRNIFRALVSRKIARSKRIWASVQGELSLDEKRVEFSEEELRSAFEETRGWEAEYANLFHEHPTLEVYYEDLAEDREHEFRRVTDFLKLPYHEPQTVLRKENTERSADLVKNFAELKSRFQNSQWSKFFEE